VFVRLAGCNLACGFCDTDYSLQIPGLPADVVRRVRDEGGECPMVVLTGGEPLASARTADLIEHCEPTDAAFTSSPTVRSSPRFPKASWLCVSPKERVDRAWPPTRRRSQADPRERARARRTPPASHALDTILLQPESNKPPNSPPRSLRADASERFRLSLQTTSLLVFVSRRRARPQEVEPTPRSVRILLRLRFQQSARALLLLGCACANSGGVATQQTQSRCIRRLPLSRFAVLALRA